MILSIFEVAFVVFALLLGICMSIADAMLTLILWIFALFFGLVIDIVDAIVAFFRWDMRD
jgi:hypothetical protein